MSKHRTGLQKQISAIFDGVPLPKNDDTQQPSSAPVPDHPDCPSDEPLAPSHFTTTVPQPEDPAPLQPKPEEPSGLEPKAAPPERTKPAAVAKAKGPSQWQQSLQRIKGKLFASKPGVKTARNKTMVILVPVLVVVFIFVLVQVFGTGTRKAGRTNKLSQTKGVVASGDKINWQIPAEWPKTLRDPMQFGSTASQAVASNLIVRGIVASEDDPAALVGSQIVREGDELLGATVLTINKDSVEFEMNGKKWKQKVQR